MFPNLNRTITGKVVLEILVYIKFIFNLQHLNYNIFSPQKKYGTSTKNKIIKKWRHKVLISHSYTRKNLNELNIYFCVKC